jgi:hypothetical protein
MKNTSAHFDTTIVNETKAHQLWFDSIRAGDSEKRQIAFSNFIAAMLQRRDVKLVQPSTSFCS